MIPRTFPSVLEGSTRKMVVYVLPSIAGLQAWKDYIPVKGVTVENTAVENTYANDGYQVMKTLDSSSGYQAWVDYIPVYEDASYSKAWSTDIGGYIPAGGLFSVLGTLFGNGEQGVWYEPSLTGGVLFQDSAGTTPVTAVEQPVGLMLDKSKGLVLGSELVTNGTFNDATGWTENYDGSNGWRITGGVAEHVGTTNVYLSSSYPITNLQWYKLTCTVTGNVKLETNNLGVITLTSGTNSYVFQATSTTNLRFYSNAAGTIDNVSVKSLAGNHAYQSTSAARPVLSARVNLLTKTEQFDQSPWTVTNASVTANSTTDPIGGNTGFLLKEDSATAWHRLNSSTFNGTGSHTLSIAAKAATRSWLAFCFYADGIAQFTYFNLSSGTVGTNASGSTASITSLGNGWYRCSVTRTLTGGVSQLIAAPSTGDGVSSYAGNGTSGIYLWGADLRVSNDGVGIPAYQRVNTSTDYDTTGFPLYIKPNGSSQFMVTNSINFTGTDKMTVFAGVRKLSDAAVSMITELSTSSTSTAGTFRLFGPSTTAAANYGFASRGSATPAVVAVTTYTSPITNVITSSGDIAGDSMVVRVNAVNAGTSTEDQGTGNFGNYPLYLFARGGTSLWFGGRLYSLIVRGAATSAANITAAEAYVNSKTKAY